MADEEQGSDRRQPRLTEGNPTWDGGHRWWYGPCVYKDVALSNERNAEIIQPFPGEPRFFVAYRRHRGWINGGLLDAMALATEFMGGKG